MPRPERLVPVGQLVEGDEVRWSTKDKAREVKHLEHLDGRIKVTLVSGAWRTYAPEDRIIRLDPKPPTKKGNRWV